MSASALKLQVNDLEASRLLGKLAAAGQNLRPLMKSIGEGLADSTKQRFVASKAPDGSRWLPNAPSTVLAFLNEFSGNFDKKGRLNKRPLRPTPY